MEAINELRRRLGADRPAARDLGTMFENVASFAAAPAVRKAQFAENRNLSAAGVNDELRRFLARGAVPEIRRTLAYVEASKASLSEARAKLSRPAIDPADTMGAAHRREAREFLRTVDAGERVRLLLDNPDPLFVAAALEMPNALSGITDEIRGHVEQSYAATMRPGELAEVEARAEALATLEAAAKIARGEIARHVGFATDQEFDGWFDTADGSAERQAA